MLRQFAEWRKGLGIPWRNAPKGPLGIAGMLILAVLAITGLGVAILVLENS